MNPIGVIPARFGFVLLAYASLCLAPVASEADDRVGPPARADAISYDRRDSDVQAPQPDPSKVNQIPPYVVQESVFKAYLSSGESETMELFGGMSTAFSPSGFGINFGTAYVSTPARAYQPLTEAPVSAAVINDNAKADPGPIWPEDGLMSAFPLWFGFRDFHPFPAPAITAFRGVGGQGQETRLLLDGVSANDPFTGTFVSAAMPAVGVARIEAVSDGGSVAWGEGDLGGAVQEFTQPDLGRVAFRPGALTAGGAPVPSLFKQVVVGTGEFLVGAGGLDTRDIEMEAVEPTPAGMLQLLGRAFTTDGSPMVLGGRSGPIDVAAFRRNQFLEVRWSQLVSKNLLLTATANGFTESDGKGTPYQFRHDEGEFASLQLEARPSRELLWTAVAYLRQSYGSDRFSAVNTDRDAEMPIFDQVATPTTETGASWSAQWRSPEGSRTSAGLDASATRGEARLLTGDTPRGFTRKLAGGGEQADEGAFMERDQELRGSMHLTVGGRVSHWDLADGHDRVTDSSSDDALATGAASGGQGTEFSPHLGVTWSPGTNWVFHVNAQQAFSRPTLGDLYRPEGEYSILTENNPALRTEHNTSFEFGGEYSFYSAKELANHRSAFIALKPPKPFLVVSVTAFDNQMRDALGSRALTSDLLLFPSGTIPSGYLDEQRINLDRSRAQGLDVLVKWQITPTLSLHGEILFDDATIQQSIPDPALAGNQLAGIPRQSSGVTLSWDPVKRLHVLAQLRYAGREYEDDENSLRLGAALTGGLAAAVTVARNVELSASLQNLSNHPAELAKSPEGFFYQGSPRTLFAALRLKW